MTSARMWEAVTIDGHQGMAEEFCRDVVVPAAQADPECIGAEWFTDHASRVVVISRWPDAESAGSWMEPAPAIALFSRAHSWVFAVGD